MSLLEEREALHENEVPKGAAKHTQTFRTGRDQIVPPANVRYPYMRSGLESLDVVSIATIELRAASAREVNCTKI